MPASRRLAWILASVHLGLVALVAVAVANGENPVAWLVFVVLDFPISLIWLALNSLVVTRPAERAITSDVGKFLLPLGFLATVGTAWWYFLGRRIQSWRASRRAGIP
jgi:hypothetical protein